MELVLVDDGSNPPFSVDDYDLPNLRIIRHDLDANWTQPAARNLGVKSAHGEWVLTTDIDHIVTKELIDVVVNTNGDVVRFARHLAILDEDGNFSQDREILKLYGVLPNLLKRRKLKVSPHCNSCAIKRDLFLRIGGVSEEKVGSGVYPNREEFALKRGLRKVFRKKEAVLAEEKPVIYMIPNGRFCGDEDYNPFGLFHSLSRKDSRVDEEV
jgi:glycosyltransferase involved in cell wall biosynthesis